MSMNTGFEESSLTPSSAAKEPSARRSRTVSEREVSSWASSEKRCAGWAVKVMRRAPAVTFLPRSVSSTAPAFTAGSR